MDEKLKLSKRRIRRTHMPTFILSLNWTEADLAEFRISSANRREILLDATAVSCQAERSGPT
jgi:hypothetical protein